MKQEKILYFEFRKKDADQTARMLADLACKKSISSDAVSFMKGMFTRVVDHIMFLSKMPEMVIIAAHLRRN